MIPKRVQLSTGNASSVRKRVTSQKSAEKGKIKSIW
jgi:hypothetical protein